MATINIGTQSVEVPDTLELEYEKRSAMPPIQCCALVYENGLAVELHYFPLPQFGQHAFYRTLTSYEATRNREASRHYKWTLSGRGPVPSPRMSLGRVDEWSLGLTFLIEVHPELPRHHHASLFAFYAEVGYDYRRKSWKPRNLRQREASGQYEVDNDKNKRRAYTRPGEPTSIGRVPGTA